MTDIFTRPRQPAPDWMDEALAIYADRADRNAWINANRAAIDAEWDELPDPTREIITPELRAIAQKEWLLNEAEAFLAELPR